jgi:two-component system, NtrC family, sensor kinase
MMKSADFQDLDELPETSALSAVIKSIKNAFVITDNKGKMFIASNAFFPLFALGISFIKGESIASFFVESDREKLLKILSDIIFTDEKSMQIPLTGICRDGSFIGLSASISRIPGEKPLFFITLEDRTEQIRDQEKIEKLEHQAAIGTFTSGVAHEFNNVLAGIRGYAQLLKNDPADIHLVLKACSIIENETIRGAEICKNLNLYSGARRLNLEPVSLSEIIQNCIDLQNGLLAGMKINILSELDNVPAVIADRHRLQQVLINLITNARHAVMPKGSGQIIVKLTTDQDSVIISVEDNGVGIPHYNLSKIFDPFFSSKTPMYNSDEGTETPKGTGLGLPVCQVIIKQHGGSIEVISSPGEWTKFIVRLPRKFAQVLPENPDTHEKQIRALVVDDEMPVREVVFRTLAHAKVHTTLARNVEDLEKIISTEKFDIIFLDYVLPEMNADRVLPMIYEKNPEARIVMISGWNGSPVKKAAIENSIDAWIDKPFDVEAILSQIKMIK